MRPALFTAPPMRGHYSDTVLSNALVRTCAGPSVQLKGSVMAYADDTFPVNLDTGEGASNTITGMLRGAASQPAPQRSALSWFMEPHEINSVPGLPDYAYADQRLRQDVGGQQGTESKSGNYASTLDQASLTPYDWNPSGLDLSRTGRSSA